MIFIFVVVAVTIGAIITLTKKETWPLGLTATIGVIILAVSSGIVYSDAEYDPLQTINGVNVFCIATPEKYDTTYMYPWGGDILKVTSNSPLTCQSIGGDDAGA